MKNWWQNWMAAGEYSKCNFTFAVLVPIVVFPLCVSEGTGSFPPAFLLENSVLADPRVDCGVETITVWIRTEKSFHGRIYVEDESDHPECVHSYASLSSHGGRGDNTPQPSLPDSRGAEFSIRFGQCNMRRQRLLNPRGVTYSFTLVISFHPVFLTGIDRAFNIKCFFMEAVKALDAALDVKPLTTSVVEREFALPQCAYHLKHGVDGPFMKYATIGEPITHVWQCDPVAGWLYGVLIHSCFVDDGHGSRFDLVDNRGCVTDRSLLAEIIYDEKAFTAYAHTHVFRYADRIQLFFTCTIQLCFREDGGCDGISPPRCLGNASTEKEPIRTLRPPFIPPPPQPPPFSSRYFRRPFVPPVRGPLLHLGPSNPFRGPPPLKDSPLFVKNNETAAEKLLDDIFLAANRSRAGRNAGGEVVGAGRMETDLSADLTVVPRTSTANGNGKISETMAEQEKEMMDSAAKNPFVRVLPIKYDEYTGAAMASIHSLDSQRYGSFEVLAIAGASFLATITVTSLLTTFCLQRCRLRNLLSHKRGMSEMIIG